MKIVVGVDLEGITGVVSSEHTSPEGRLYREAVELMAGDINAAVEGLVDAGVDDIVVWDNHGPTMNAPFGPLHEAATYMRGTGANLKRWTEIDDKTDGLILLGYHAKAGTLHGVLEHTMSGSSWYKLKVNEREIGEIAIDGAMAGAMGVPVIMASGCDKLCAEAVDVFGPDIVTVCVKQGHGRHGATCLPAARTRIMIRQGAAEAVKRIGKVRPLDLGSPAVVELTYKHTAHADGMDLRRFNGRRIDGYTIQWTAPSFAEWHGHTVADPPPQ
jgi:D-amino peptidase